MKFKLYKQLPIEAQDTLVCTGTFMLHNEWATIEVDGVVKEQIHNAKIFFFSFTDRIVLKVRGLEDAGTNTKGVKLYSDQVWLLNSVVE